VIVVLAGLLPITRGRALIVGALCFVYFVVTFVVVLVDRGAVGEQLTRRWNDNATHYDVLFVLAAVFVLLSGAGRAPRVRAVLTGIVALQLAVVIGFAYRHDNPRSGGPEWTSGLAAAKTECEARHLSEVNVPTSPGGVFMVQLPCHDLE